MTRSVKDVVTVSVAIGALASVGFISGFMTGSIYRARKIKIHDEERNLTKVRFAYGDNDYYVPLLQFFVDASSTDKKVYSTPMFNENNQLIGYSFCSKDQKFVEEEA